MKRLLGTRLLLPSWVATPFLFLGLAFVVFYPIVVARHSGAWFFYGAALVFAIGLALFGWRRRGRITVLERSEEAITYRFERRRES